MSRPKVTAKRADPGADVEAIDIRAWARDYVATVLELEGYAPPSGSAAPADRRMGAPDPIPAAGSR